MALFNTLVNEIASYHNHVLVFCSQSFRYYLAKYYSYFIVFLSHRIVLSCNAQTGCILFVHNDCFLQRAKSLKCNYQVVIHTRFLLNCLS